MSMCVCGARFVIGATSFLYLSVLALSQVKYCIRLTKQCSSLFVRGVISCISGAVSVARDV